MNSKFIKNLKLFKSDDTPAPRAHNNAAPQGKNKKESLWKNVLTIFDIPAASRHIRDTFVVFLCIA